MAGEKFLDNGDIYVGGFVDGKRSGLGNYFHKKTGNLFRGNWLNDRREGRGVLHFAASGKDLHGHWVNDVCVAGQFVGDKLPALELETPDGIMEACHRSIEDERKVYRANFSPVAEILPAELLAKATAMYQANSAAFGVANEAAAMRTAVQASLDALDIPAQVKIEDIQQQRELGLEPFLRIVAINYVKSR